MANDIDDDATAVREAVRAWMMRDKRRKQKPKDEPVKVEDIDWQKY